MPDQLSDRPGLFCSDAVESAGFALVSAETDLHLASYRCVINDNLVGTGDNLSDRFDAIGLLFTEILRRGSSIVHPFQFILT